MTWTTYILYMSQQMNLDMLYTTQQMNLHMPQDVCMLYTHDGSPQMTLSMPYSLYKPTGTRLPTGGPAVQRCRCPEESELWRAAPLAGGPAPRQPVVTPRSAPEGPNRPGARAGRLGARGPGGPDGRDTRSP